MYGNFTGKYKMPKPLLSQQGETDCMEILQGENIYVGTHTVTKGWNWQQGIITSMLVGTQNRMSVTDHFKKYPFNK